MTPMPPKILIVDDEPANIQVLAEALGDGYDLRFSTDGSRVAALAAESAVDLILLDLVMPGRDGFSVLAELRADPATRGIPVIIVTAMIETADEEAGLNAGAVDYITKPISPPIVRARVRTHVELKRQRDLLSDLASLDGLTGIANRRRFDERFAQQWRQQQRHGGGLTVMLADVDHFKQFNDHYGHGAGDDCLRQVGRALAACCSRADDFAARYGGEEFVLLAPAADGPQQVGRVLQAVAALAIPHAHSSATDRVSLSLGAVEVEPSAALAPAMVLEQADRMLYEAKRGGRNRAVYLRLADGARQLIQG